MADTISISDLSEFFGVSRSTVVAWKLPKVKRGCYDLLECCQAIMEDPNRGKFSKVKKKAIAYVKGFISSPQEGNKPKKKEEAPEVPLTKSDKDMMDKEGVLGMIKRLRVEEKVSHLRYKKVCDNPLEAEPAFDIWSKITDRLTKAEKQLDEILVKRSAVVSIDEANEVFFERVIPVKQQLKSLPSDCCLELAAIKDPDEIRKLLEDKIRRIIRGISNEK